MVARNELISRGKTCDTADIGIPAANEQRTKRPLVLPTAITNRADAKVLIEYHLSMKTSERILRELHEPGYAELIAAAWRMVMP
ncbi:MAG: hypothetical protein MI923_10660 [Phycisphaerales bacterium]|nr:hypothetical protein [Phycisphaerales bacterium]